jgi:hypothetical protein
MDGQTAIALTGVVIAALSLGYTIYRDRRRTRRKTQHGR